METKISIHVKHVDGRTSIYRRTDDESEKIGNISKRFGPAEANLIRITRGLQREGRRLQRESNQRLLGGEPKYATTALWSLLLNDCGYIESYHGRNLHRMCEQADSFLSED